MKKGLIFDIRRYSVHDGPGIRTTVFLKACPLSCPWCHNPEGISAEPQEITRHRKLNGKTTTYKETIGKWLSAGEVMDVILKDRIFYDESGGGVTFSGGEPLMQAEFLLSLLFQCKEAGIHTAVDTSGHAPREIFNLIALNTDLLLYDLKSVDNSMHLIHTGVSNNFILQNLKSLTEDGPRLIIRIPVIHGFNSEEDQMKSICDQLLKLRVPVKRVDLLPYHRLGQQKYRDLGMNTPINFNTEISEVHLNKLMSLFSGCGFDVKKGG